MVIFYILHSGSIQNGGYIESEESKIKTGYGLDIFFHVKLWWKNQLASFLWVMKILAGNLDILTCCIIWFDEVVQKKQNIIYRYFNLKERERESNSKVKKENSPHKGLPGGAWARTRGKRVTLDWHLHGGWETLLQR